MFCVTHLHTDNVLATSAVPASLLFSGTGCVCVYILESRAKYDTAG